MKELYTISILGNLQGICIAVFVISLVASIILCIAYIFEKVDNGSYEDIWPFLKIMIIILCVSSLVTIFAPSKKDLYAIYGIGTAIDYLQQNEDAKQLPDKTIKVLNAFADHYIDEVDEKTEKDKNKSKE